MLENQSPSEVIAGLAEDFVARYRNGERPPVSEYTDKHPELAEEIREFFGAVAMVENLAPVANGSTGGAPSGPPSSVRTKVVPPFTLLGDYRILKEIGRGGMGVVYEAEQVSLGRHVALKVLPVHVAKDTRLLERFRREVRAAAKLHHSNIVPVFEAGEADDVRFYAMQYIQGQSLDTVIDELGRMRSGEPVPRPRGPQDRESFGTEPESFSKCGRSSPNSTRPEPTVAIAQALVAGHFSTPVQMEPTGSTPATAHGSLDLAVDDGATAADETEVVRVQEPTQAIQALRARTATISSASSISLLGQSDLSHRSGALSPFYYQSVARIGIQVAEALAYAHDRGVVHRDIKPSNLLLDLAGTVWVTDFGLAKEQEDGLTQTGDIVGTLRFMAPERFRGAVDGRSDIYSLGATLYELVTLRPAFQGADHLQLLERVTHTEPMRPRSLDPRLPADLETVILKALDKDPARRYQTALQLAEDLRCFLDYRPIEARRSGSLERIWRWCRRNPIVAALMTVTAALLIVIALGLSVDSMRLRVQLKRAEDAEQSERQALLKVTAAHAEEIAAHRTTDLALFDAHLSEARAEHVSRRPGQRFQTLAAVRKALRLAETLGITPEQRLALRNAAIAGLALPDMRVVREWPGWPAGTMTMAFDGAQTRYARLSRHGEISVRSVRDAERDHEIFRLMGIVGEAWLKFSRNGRYLSAWCAVGQRLILWDLDGSTARVIVDEPSPSSFQSDFSPDGALFAFADSKGEVNLVDLSSGNSLRKLNAGPSPGRIAFHPSRRQIAVVSNGNLVRICDLDSVAILAELPQPGPVHQLEWHPDGGSLAIVTNDWTIRLWDVAGQRLTSSLVGHRNGGIFLAFNPSGDLLASCDWNRVTRLWDPRRAVQVFQVSEDPAVPRFHVDRDQLSTYDSEAGAIQLWEIASGREYRTLVRSPNFGAGTYHMPAISPDGRLLVAGMEDGLAFWDLVTGDPLDFIATGRTGRLVFEAGGALLTNGASGALRWPVEWAVDSPASLRVGLPERLALPASSFFIACSGDGRVIATAQGNGAVVLHRDDPNHVATRVPHADARYVAVSRDGRWVATGSHNGPGVKVWDAASGELQRELIPDQFLTTVGFSPDGRWLVTTGGGCRLWNVGDWSEAARIGGLCFAFSANSQMLAVGTNRGSVRLVDPETGAEFARLEDPNQDDAVALAFSPDGRRLVMTVNQSTTALHVWDLQTIRKQLAELGLDWELPPYAADDIGQQRESNGVSGDLTEWGLVRPSATQRISLTVDHAAIQRALKNK